MGLTLKLPHIVTFSCIGPGDFNLYTTELFLGMDSLSSGITIDALRDDEDRNDGMFESFRLTLVHQPNVLPPNIVLGTAVITIENIGV